MKRIDGNGNVIEYCYHNCNYFNLDGGPGPVMICSHPELKKSDIDAVRMGYIITHPVCTEGFPKRCPLTSV